MADYPIVSTQGMYILGGLTSSPNNDGDAAWATECSDDSQDVAAGSRVNYYTITSGTDRVNVARVVLFFDTTELSPSLEITHAGIWALCRYTQPVSLTKISDTVHIVPCPSVHRPCVEADYGYVGSCGTSVGSLYIPVDLPLGYRYIPLSSAGIAAINPGGLTPFGIRAARDMTVSFPGWDKQFSWLFHGGTYLRINDPVSGGYIWVEGTKFAYIDAYLDKRTIEGTDTGDNGTVAGEAWVDGTYWYYVDENLDIRRVQGTLTGLTGKVAGQLSINTKNPMYGTHSCYIDDTGAERCFEGTA